MNGYSIGAALAAAVLFTAAPCAGAWAFDDDHSWSPALDMVIFRLEGMLDGLDNQEEINGLLIEIAELFDAELYIEFHERLQGLDGPEREAAMLEQIAWLAARQKAVQELDGDSDMRTTGPAERALVFIRITRERLDGLEVPLHHTSSDAVPPDY